MNRIARHADVTDNETRIGQAEARAGQAEARSEQAKTRTELAETRTEQAETRTDLAKTRTEQAETRTELAKTRTEQAEIRTERAETRTEEVETTLQRMVHKEVNLRQETSRELIQQLPRQGIADRNSSLELLTGRQRAILKLIAEGRNTKEIAGILKLSPKTIEYHRLKLMDRLNVHDIPGLVRLALRVGLIPPES
jgi:DNA-binding CsgD family transcriptional regulator